MTDPATFTVTVTVPVTGQPDILDWTSRKFTLTPRTATLIYRIGTRGPVSVDVTGPTRSVPGIQPSAVEMTVTYYHQWPEHWPQWVRDLGTAHVPPGWFDPWEDAFGTTPDGLQHRLGRTRYGFDGQAFSLCGREVTELPDPVPVTCPTCAAMLAGNPPE